jgi:ABC-2 type transport system permease protein
VRRALAIARKGFRHRLRDNFVFLVIVQPMIFCFVWGYCASLELRDVRVAVLDLSRGAEGREAVRALEATGTFTVAARVSSLAELERALVAGRVGLGVVITPRPSTGTADPAPAAMDAAAAPRRAPAGASVAVLADGTDPLIAGRALAAAVRALADPTGGPAVTVRPWYHPSLRSRDLVLLGAVAYNLVWFLMYPAMLLMTERERGSLEALATTPVTTFELWLGTLVSSLAFALWGSLTQIALIVHVAGVPFRGELALLLVGLVLLGAIHVNLGCVLAVIARTGPQRTLLGFFFVFLMLAVSGFLIPSVSLPPVVRALGELSPLHHGLVFLRALFLKGADAVAVRHELVALTAALAATTILALGSVRALLHPSEAR